MAAQDEDFVFEVQGLVLLTNMGRLPISHLFDINGEATKEPAEAVSAVVMLPDGRWGAFAGIEQDDIVSAESASN